MAKILRHHFARLACGYRNREASECLQRRATSRTVASREDIREEPSTTGTLAPLPPPRSSGAFANVFLPQCQSSNTHGQDQFSSNMHATTVVSGPSVHSPVYGRSISGIDRDMFYPKHRYCSTREAGGENVITHGGADGWLAPSAPSTSGNLCRSDVPHRCPFAHNAGRRVQWHNTLTFYLPQVLMHS